MIALFAGLFLTLSPAFSQPLFKSQWNGAKVAFLGDSITDERQVEKTNNTYWNFLSEMLGITPYVYGINGNRMNQIVPQGKKLLEEHGSEVDAIIVFAGTNDYNASIPMGEFYTTEEASVEEDGHVMVQRKKRTMVLSEDTFKGRLNCAMKYLKETFPGKQIIFLTPLHRGYATFGDDNIQPDESYSNGQGLFIEDYMQAVKDAGVLWAIPVIDLASESGLYPMLDSQAGYFRNAETDRLHPNTPGHKRMAYALAGRLASMPVKFPKYVCLSFDDGPNTKTTPVMLDVLKKHGVRGSFFVIGQNINEQSAKMMQRAVEQGCQVENHSFTHSSMPELSEEQIADEIERTSALVEKYTGRAPRYFRPPYINVDEKMYRTIPLTFICGRGCEDWEEKVTAKMRAERVLSEVQDGDILLLHDFEGNEATAEALDIIIPELKARGFEFLTVEEMFRLRGTDPAPHNGVIYTNVY